MPIDAFRRLEPWLIAGAQPQDDGYAWLRDQGVQLVVSLRTHDDSQAMEERAPQLLSVRIPVNNHRPPTTEQAQKWLHLCQICANQHVGIYVHCHAGHGRTSTFCALVRIAQGWDVARAIGEERRYGFDPDSEKDQANFLRQTSMTGTLTLPTTDDLK